MDPQTSEKFLLELKNRQRLHSWIFIAVWISCIYTLAFFAIPISGFVLRLTNIKFLMTLLFLFILFFFVLSLFKKSGLHKTRTFVLTLSTIIVFASQYFLGTMHAKQYHLIEYSILSYFLYNTLRADFQGIRVWLFAFAGSVLVGVGDEVLQHFIAGRFATIADVGVDMKGAAFGLMFATIVELEKKLLSLEKGREP